MNTYHKIQTVWLRDPDNNYKTLLEGRWALPEFQYLAENEWVFTEKVDGTNMRIIFDGCLQFRGKTDAAQLHKPLESRLEEIFSIEKMREVFGDTPVCLYGEGYGSKIQKVGGLYRDSQDFVLFDVKIGDNWLERENVEDVAAKLNLDLVPILGSGTLHKAIEMVSAGFDSRWGNFTAEGIVARPSVEMKNRIGKRIITKIKHKDFL